MPEYLSPGVYVEETSFRSKSIEGVSTTTSGFIGPTRYGPVTLEPDLLTSVGEFERTYGDGQKLAFADGVGRDNFLWHAVRAFFAEGGRRLYVSRVFRRLAASADEPDSVLYAGPDEEPAADGGGNWADGHARNEVASGSPLGVALTIRARYPGAGGNARVRLSLRIGQSVLAAGQQLRGLVDRDVVLILEGAAPGEAVDHPLYTARRADDGTWTFEGLDRAGAASNRALSTLSDTARVCPVTVSVGVRLPGGFEETWEGLALDPDHRREGADDSLTGRFFFDRQDVNRNRALPIVVETEAASGTLVAEAILAASPVGLALADARASAGGLTEQRYLEALERAATAEVRLAGGNDGALPDPADYEGRADPTASFTTGLRQFEMIDDVSIVAAPGSSYASSDAAEARVGPLAIAGHLIAHAVSMRYRIAVLDSMNNQPIGSVREYRARLDSSYAALYYPWVRVLDPITRVELSLPPSGFVAGIYARNDIERAVYKAPANEVVRLALGFELTLNKSQQDVLNPEGINCFRYFEGRGNRLWGARTISSDPEWKYVNIRRYFAYLEHSIDKGTQWAVFEPNGERLWANVRRTIEDFLTNEYQNGALLGDRPERAFFVKCDRSTMTQNDLDNGRLVCLIGVAPIKPAEFVIFRIGQWTGDRKV